MDKMSQESETRPGEAPWQIPAAPLNVQLSQDESGALRDKILDELAVAGQDIDTALNASVSPAGMTVLRDLLAAVRLAEQTVIQAWASFHT